MSLSIDGLVIAYILNGVGILVELNRGSHATTSDCCLSSCCRLNMSWISLKIKFFEIFYTGIVSPIYLHLPDFTEVQVAALLKVFLDIPFLVREIEIKLLPAGRRLLLLPMNCSLNRLGLIS